MKRREYTPEKIIGLLRRAEVELAQDKRVTSATSHLVCANSFEDLGPTLFMIDKIDVFKHLARPA